MKCLYTFFLCIGLLFAQAQLQEVKVKLINDFIKQPPDNYKLNKSGPSNPVSCGVDTLPYGLYKASPVPLPAVNVFKGYSLGQYFDAPGEVTISGFDFYAWQSAGTKDSVTLICKIYNTGTDSIPNGVAQRTETIKIDSAFGGSLLSLRKRIVFSSPYTTTKPFILSVESDDTVRCALVVNSYNDKDGNAEWLGCGSVAGVWRNFRYLNIGGKALDCDVLLEPFVKYDIYADFSFKDCYKYTDSVKFINKSSPFISNQMYNRYVFYNLEYICYRWNYGGNPFFTYVVDGATKYSSPQNQNITLISNIYGYRNFSNCTDTMVKPLKYQPSQITLVGKTILCSGDSLDLMAIGDAPMYWYDPALDTPFFIGNRYITPPLFSNDTVTVKSVNGFCQSTGIRIIAEVKETPKTPVVTDDYVCVNSKANLSATTNIGNVFWFKDSIGGISFFTGNLLVTDPLTVDQSYYVQADNFGCLSAGRVKVTAHVDANFAPDEPVVSPDTAICLLDNPIELRASSAKGDTIKWYNIASGGTPVQIQGNFSFVPTSFGVTKIYVEAYNGKCASSRLSISVSVNHFAPVTYAKNNEICQNDTALLEAMTERGSVNWYKNVSDKVPFFTGFALQNQNTTSSQTFYLEPFEGACKDTQRYAINLVVHPFGVITTSLYPNVCKGRTIQLNAVSNYGQIKWYDSPTFDTLLATGGRLTAEKVNENRHYYLVSDNKGCISLPVHVTLSFIPGADATFDFAVLDWRNVEFKARRGAQGLYLWDFDDAGITLNGESVKHFFSKDGTYNVKLFVTSTAGCKDTFIRQITLETSGINEQTGGGWKVMPNPFTDEITLLAPVEFTGKFRVQMMSMSGQILFDEELEVDEKGQLRLDISDRTKQGSYMLIISSEFNHRFLKTISVGN
jgi:hypothetical protein